MRKSLLAALLFLVAFPTLSLSCSSPQQRRDKNIARSLKRSSQKAEQRPKSAATAYEYADAFELAYETGFYDRHPDRPMPADRVTHFLDVAASAQPGEALALRTRKAEILLLVGRTQDGRDILWNLVQQSMYRPAAKLLVESMGEAGEVERVADFCGQYVPTLSDRERKFNFMTTCIFESGATSAETGLHWASPEDRAFYMERREEVKQEEQEMREQRQRQLAEQRQQEAEQEAYRRQQLAKRNACYSGCDEDNGYCRSDCGYVEQCYAECDRAKNACYHQCEARVHVPLSPAQKRFREALGL